jgi:hypothetical protein
MAIDPKVVEKLFGAKYVGEVPAVGGGPFGMARLAHILHERLTPSQGQRPGRPTDAAWDNRSKVPMSEATKQHLAELARRMSTPERQVSPMQVAAQLLEDAVRDVLLEQSRGKEPVAKPKNENRGEDNQIAPGPIPKEQLQAPVPRPAKPVSPKAAAHRKKRKHRRDKRD